MTYGLSPHLFIENGAANLAAKRAAARSSSRNLVAWRKLDADRRLALVEKALPPAAADDSLGGYGLAL